MALRQRRKVFAAALALTLAATAAACGEDEDDDDAGTDDGDGQEEEAIDFLGCEVTDTGGVDDNSFNETAWNGMLQAGEELGFEPKVQESTAESDYEPNITSLIDQGCDLIVTIGFLLGDATAAAAETNPDQSFAIVDYDYSTAGGDAADEYENVRELVFSTDEAAFLAGYLAAGMTESGKVGTYGGLNIPTVTIFMKGFEAGIEQYNEDNDEDVELLGWSTEADDGRFTGDFDNQDNGRTQTEQLMDEGADIIMPVAGPVGQGSIQAVRNRGEGSATLIWVDTDGCESVADACDLFLTSVMKNMDVAVHDTAIATAEDEFEGGEAGKYVGTLENDGVGIADYHEFEEEVPPDLKDRIEELRQQIVDGEIDPNPGG